MQRSVLHKYSPEMGIFCATPIIPSIIVSLGGVRSLPIVDTSRVVRLARIYEVGRLPGREGDQQGVARLCLQFQAVAFSPTAPSYPLALLLEDSNNGLATTEQEQRAGNYR